jgi:hypothetical protein
MMKGIRNILLFLLFAGSFGSVSAQHFIGLNPTEIAALMKSEQPQFKLDKSAVNHTYKYLKYVDKISEQTILLFLSDKDICTYVRWMSDYANLNDIIGKLNASYRKTGVNNWSYTQKNEKYTVKLEEEEWYFTITYRKN